MQSTTSSLKGSVTVDEYVQPLDLLPPSTGLLGRVRDELGPWRSHSAVKDVTVDVDDQGAVRITFEVFGAAAARCDLPVAMWISALRGCRVVVHHRVVDHESPWFAALGLFFMFLFGGRISFLFIFFCIFADSSNYRCFCYLPLWPPRHPGHLKMASLLFLFLAFVYSSACRFDLFFFLVSFSCWCFSSHALCGYWRMGGG
jgi:hypothetical protein